MKQEDVEILGENLAQKVLDCRPLKPDIEKYIGMSFYVHGEDQLLLRASFQTNLDYIPQIHVLIRGNVINDIFVPLHAEIGTVINKMIPSHFIVTKSAIRPEINPLSDLIRVDERFHALMKSVVEFDERSTGNLRFRFRGESFHHNKQTFVGIAFLPKIDSVLSIIKGSNSDIKVRTWNYQFPSHFFEILLRLAYYVNYLNYPFHSPSTIDKTELSLPAVLVAK
ncbi:MAG: hypothetical protein RTV72_02010 [Candidatus Thorarchaeota archaeon]